MGKCIRCGIEKQITAFPKNRRKIGERHLTCRKCYATNQLEVWKRTPEQIEAHRQKLLGRKYTIEHRLAISKGQRKAVKEGRHHWKKNEKAHKDQPRTHIEYKIWKEKLLIRAQEKCEKCGNQNRLHAHHIKCFYKFPRLRFDIENGQILCISCHHRLHKTKGKDV